jgi:hypothetical protein
MFREDSLRGSVCANLQITTGWNHSLGRPLIARAAGTRRRGYVAWSGNVAQKHAKALHVICIIDRYPSQLIFLVYKRN